MLSLNKILIFVLIGIFSSSLYAVDISKFDIKGIKLGMSKSEVLKKMPCSNPEIHAEKLRNGKIVEIYIRCKENSFLVVLDHKNYVYLVSMLINFKTEPNFQKIKNKVFNKYGKPTRQANQKVISRGKGERIVYCWGKHCQVSKQNNGVWKGTKISNYPDYKSLLIDYVNYDIESVELNRLNFNLLDSNRRNDSWEWSTQQEKLYEKKEKEKASDIDF
jgi:hypothetical protein